MATYLVTMENEIVDEVEAKSIREVAEGLVEGAYRVYTLQGPSKVVHIRQVTTTAVDIFSDESDGSEPEIEEE